MAPDGRVNQIKRCQNCGHEEYQLVTKASPFFSDWRFQCVQCLATKEVVQADRETLELLKPGMDAGHGNLPKEWNMLPVSYRASSVFYAQTDSFILFRDAEVTTLLTAARRSELVSRLMKLYNFPGTPLTHDEVMRQLKENGRNDEAKNYKDLLEILKVISVPAMKETMERQLSEKRAAYEADGLIAKQHLQSQALASQVEANQEWARRYNPIRLAVEHSSFRSEVIDRQGTDPSLPAISVLNPEVCDIDAADAKERKSYTATVEHHLLRLGIDELVLLRGLDICEFSFGYTRVSSTPSTTVKDREMPVRLCAFDYVEKNKRPIYLLEQKNEGFYIRLNEKRVIEWLCQNGLGEQLPPRDGMRLGGLLIEEYADFGRFVEDYRERATPPTPRSLANYVYLLLHTMAHHFAHAVVEYSGLEHGSIGEYLFPSDLAFLVYRRGMTPDLGNLSAMWRNHGLTVLEQLLSDRALKCDGGSLCDQRGGACPACIMAPEVACIAGNNLLSRAALGGGVPPGWDADRAPLAGFFRLGAKCRMSASIPEEAIVDAVLFEPLAAAALLVHLANCNVALNSGRAVRRHCARAEYYLAKAGFRACGDAQSGIAVPNGRRHIPHRLQKRRTAVRGGAARSRLRTVSPTGLQSSRNHSKPTRPSLPTDGNASEARFFLDPPLRHERQSD